MKTRLALTYKIMLLQLALSFYSILPNSLPALARGLNQQPNSKQSDSQPTNPNFEKPDPPGEVKQGRMKLRVVKTDYPQGGIAGAPDLDTIEGDVHVVNVYEGQYPGGGSPHNYYYNPQNGWVDLTISRKPGPIVVFLGSYEYIDWRFNVEPGTTISAVIIMTYHPCTVSGLSDSVPVYMSCYEQPKKLRPNTFILPFEPDNELKASEPTNRGRRAKVLNFVQRHLHRGIASYRYENKVGSVRI